MNEASLAQKPHTTNPSAPTQRWIFAGVITCFVLSGFAALLYQTAWLRQFSIVFGTSELAVATVLAAYMAGLAGGAAIAERWVANVSRPILVYGCLEAGIALSALLTPLLLDLASSLYVAVLGGNATLPTSLGMTKSVFYLIVAFLVLALPTGFMGATLPFLTRYAIHNDRQVGPRTAILYSSNTFGAVLGTIATAFILLPALGLGLTVLVGVATNGLVFLLASGLAIANARQMPLHHTHDPSRAIDTPTNISQPTSSYEQNTVKWPRVAHLILPLILLSGITSFCYEVLWTRLLNHALGGSIFAFATMLATFLAGIALGSAVATRFTNNRTAATLGFIVCQCGIAIGSMLVYFSLDALMPASFDTTNRIVFVAAVLLPSTLFIGATFPLAVRILTDDHRRVGNTSAKVYSWNTVGGIVGAIAAGFWVIPTLDYSGTIYLLVCINLGIALAASVLILQQRIVSASIATAAIAIAVLFQPERPQAVLHASYMSDKAHVGYQQRGEDFFYAVGRSATILMRYGNDGFYTLQSNGLNESRVTPRGYPLSFHPEHWLSGLPTLLNPAAKDMLVIGLGGGVVVEAIAPHIEHIDVIELEPEVIAANRAVADKRKWDPLQDPRITLVHNDARGALALTDKRYDIIVSQPSHPWTAGASHLYTSEFAHIVAEHLNDNGIFLQWIDAPFINHALLQRMVATLHSAFPYVNLFEHQPGTLHFVASKQPVNPVDQIDAISATLARYHSHYTKIGASGIEDILLAWSLDDAGMRKLSKNAHANTDDDNALAMLKTFSTHKEALSGIAKQRQKYDPLETLFENDNQSVDIGFLTARMLEKGFHERATQLLAATKNASQHHFGDALLALRAGNFSDATQRLYDSLAADKNNTLARELILKLNKAQLSARPLPQALQNDADYLPKNSRAVIDGLQYAAQKNWQQLRELEAALSNVRAASPWLSEAAQLRVQWRLALQKTMPESDSLDIIDRALLLDSNNADLLALRLSVGRQTNDSEVVIETATLLGRLYLQRYQSLLGFRRSDRQHQLSQLQQSCRELSALVGSFKFGDSPQRQRVARLLSELNNVE